MKPRSWYFLIHRIPARPLYLRARVRTLLDRLGAVPLKKAVYVLPQAPGALDRLREVEAEIRAGAGEAFVCEARFPSPDDEALLVETFQERRRLEYARLASKAQAWLAKVGARKTAHPAWEAGRAQLDRELARITAVDFFSAGGREEATARLAELGRALRPSSRKRAPAGSRSWEGRTWVTRRGILVDRMACAWFIRRFLDAAARFRFAAPPHGLRAGETGFDMPGGEFSHEAGGCSLETLIAKTGIRDAALTRIAEIVHELDLRDGQFARPETAGVEQILSGIVAAHPDDQGRLERGLVLFDDLYRSWKRVPLAKVANPPDRRGRA